MGKVGNTLNVKFDGVTIEQNADALRLKDGGITNDKIATAAAIAQSKLAMNAATTRGSAAGINQSHLGLAAFDAAQFTLTSGFATVHALDGGTY